MLSNRQPLLEGSIDAMEGWMYLGNLTDSLQAYVAADGAALVHRAGRLRPRVEGVDEQVQPDDGDSQPWEAALQALRRLVAANGRTGLPLDVVVSSEFVRFALIPGIHLNLSSTQLQALVNSRVARILGESMSSWNLRYCALDSSTLLAAAIRTPLLADLARLAGECRLKLRSVSPLWSCAINRRHAQFTGESGWLVLAESRAATFGLIENGKWVCLRTRMLDPEQSSGLMPLLERERRNVGSGLSDISLVADVPGKGLALEGDWSLRYPLPASPRAMNLSPACHAAAMAGH